MNPPSSSSCIRRHRYDVFLSFRGKDTRNNFTSYLHDALCKEGIEAFIDNELKRGEEISPALLKTIEESKISIIIFSKNFASSPWCLDELVKILECKNQHRQKVFPVFYRINPSDVEEQTGSFGKPFAEYEKSHRVNMDKVQRWRAALTEAANLAGWDSRAIRPEPRLIKKIIADISKELYDMISSDNSALVGIDSRISTIKSSLSIELEDFSIAVGIWGMGGVGKTTLAEVIFNQIYSKFDGWCFLANVREELEKHGTVYLRNKFLVRILGDTNSFMGVDCLEHPPIKNRLARKMVLIVLDDVTDTNQVKSVIGGLDWFARGSRIIITTRDKGVLANMGVKAIEIEGLREHETLQLFCKYAFNDDTAKKGFANRSNWIVKYAEGNPLALRVLGSFLFGRNRYEWKSAVKALKESPNSDIQKVLKISYDGLNSSEKDLFLDITCFFKGSSKNRAIKILDACGFHAGIGISVLVEKSLVTIFSNGDLWVHDLLAEMVKEIICQESLKEPGKRSRLWNHKEVCHVLATNKGTPSVEGIYMDLSKITREVHLTPEAFRMMYNLRVLIFNDPTGNSTCKVHLPDGGLRYLSNKLRVLSWFGYPAKSLPSTFSGKNLVELKLRGSNIELLWDGTQCLPNLRRFDLSDSKNLLKLPDFSQAKNLESLLLKGCSSLVEVHLSISVLNKLAFLLVEGCPNLRTLPSTISSKSLKIVIIKDCSNIKKPPKFTATVEGIELGLPMGKLSLEPLSSLLELTLCYCNLSEISDRFDLLPSLESLDLRGNNFLSLPPSIKQLSQLKYLDISVCKRLQSLPELPFNLESLDANDCISLECISVPSARNDVAEWECLERNYCKCIKLDINNVFLDAQMKFQLMARTMLEKGPDFNRRDPYLQICYPGCEVPTWFNYQGVGSSVIFYLPIPPTHYSDKLLGFAVCAVIEDWDDDISLLYCSFKTCNNEWVEHIFDLTYKCFRFVKEEEHVFLSYVPPWHLGIQLAQHWLG